MESKSINLIHFDDINSDEAVEFDTIVVETFSDLIEKAKASLIEEEKINKNDEINFYSPQIRRFVNADNFTSWLEKLLYVEKVVIYCNRVEVGKESNWDKEKEKLDTQFKLPNWLHLFDLLSTVPPLILTAERKEGKPASDPLLITPSEYKTSSESTNVSVTTEVKEWPNFCDDFTNFQNQIKAISELNKDECIYSPIRFPLNEIYVESEYQTKYHHISWLNSAFWDQIYKDHWFTQKLYGDVYLKNKEYTINDFFSQVKSVDSLTFPESARELIRSYKENQTPNAVKIHDAIEEVVDYTLDLINSDQNERCSYSILTNHNVTYCFKLIVDEKKAHLYVSEPIERDKQYLAVFFMLLLRYPSLTPEGFDSVQTLLGKIDKKFNC